MYSLNTLLSTLHTLSLEETSRTYKFQCSFDSLDHWNFEMLMKDFLKSNDTMQKYEKATLCSLTRNLECLRPKVVARLVASDTSGIPAFRLGSTLQVRLARAMSPFKAPISSPTLFASLIQRIKQEGLIY